MLVSRARRPKSAVDAAFDAIASELAAGRDVAIAGFGKISVSERAAPDGRNPSSGETIQIAASTVAKFSAAAALKSSSTAAPAAHPAQLRAAGSFADDGSFSGWAAPWREHQLSGGGDLPRARRAGRNQDKTVGLQQPQCLGHEVGPIVPRRGAHSGDLTGADGLSVLLVLGVSQRAQHDSLLGSHRARNLAV